jgi:hypothetical protein
MMLLAAIVEVPQAAEALMASLDGAPDGAHWQQVWQEARDRADLDDDDRARLERLMAIADGASAGAAGTSALRPFRCHRAQIVRYSFGIRLSAAIGGASQSEPALGGSRPSAAPPRSEGSA